MAFTRDKMLSGSHGESSVPSRNPSSVRLPGVVFTAASWLLVSGSLLLFGMLLLDGTLGSGNLGSVTAVRFAPVEMRAVEGRMHLDEDGSALLTPSHSKRILLTSGPIDVNAGDYRFFQWRALDIGAEVSTLLFWRPLGSTQLSVIPLRWSGLRGGVIDLGNEPAWNGRTGEIGLAFEAVAQSRIRLQGLALLPPSIGKRLEALLDAWLVFTPLTQKTANFLYLGEPETAVPLTLAAALWLGVAVLAYLLYAAVRGAADLRVVAAIAVLVWLVLDARWGTEAWHQLTLTTDRYAGKTWQEKNQSLRDAALFSLASRLKTVLPTSPQRIFVLTEKTGDRSEWERERMQYHLLPHNPFAYRTAASFLNRMAPGDYVLSLGTGKRAENLFLRKQDAGLRLELVYRDDLARLYRCRPAESRS